MKKIYQISVNQLADFYKGTDAKKSRIIRQQKNPNPIRISYYQLAKARIKKSLQLKGEIEPILNGIKELNNRKLSNKRQVNDRTVSIEAMERYIKMSLPKIFINSEYEVIKVPKNKTVIVNGVSVIVSPDIIVKIISDGEVFMGGVKMHISKSNIFSSEQQNIVATSIYKYLNDEIAINGEVVMPELCFSLDVFGKGYSATSPNIDYSLQNIESICDEIVSIWNAA